MFYKSNSDGYQQILGGIQLKTLVNGEKTLFTEFHLQRGSQLPSHTHPQEQTGYLIAEHHCNRCPKQLNVMDHGKHFIYNFFRFLIDSIDFDCFIECFGLFQHDKNGAEVSVSLPGSFI